MTTSLAASLSSAPSSPVLPVSQIPHMRNLQTRMCEECGYRKRSGKHWTCSACAGYYTPVRSNLEPADPVVVQRVIAGELLPTNIAERREVVSILTRRGLSEREIARRLGVAPRTVARYRATLRRAA